MTPGLVVAGSALFICYMHESKPFFSHHAQECAASVKVILLAEKSRHHSVSKLARRVGLNPRTLQDCFKNCYGKSIFLFGQDMRLENSRQLLRDPRLTIQSIAEQSGYAEQANFSFAFKRKYGVSPGEWRREFA